jgi:hypothetical protein
MNAEMPATGVFSQSRTAHNTAPAGPASIHHYVLAVAHRLAALAIEPIYEDRGRSGGLGAAPTMRIDGPEVPLVSGVPLLMVPIVFPENASLFLEGGSLAD